MNLAEAGALTNRAIDSLADIIPGSGTVSNLIKGSFKTFGNGLELLTGFVQQNVEAFRMLSKVGSYFSGNLGVMDYYRLRNVEADTDMRENISKGVDLLIGTPGRINDHIRRKTFHLNYLRSLVLDEADEMLDLMEISSPHIASAAIRAINRKK